MRSLLLDTNILMLLIVGTFDRNVISRHRRTAVFAAPDLDLLTNQMARYRRTLTTPPVLTEASNLLGNAHERLVPSMIEACTPMVEIVRPKQKIFAQEGFDRLGYADASILAALNRNVVVLTDDVQLYNQVLYLGHKAVNFNHLREFGE